MRKSFSASVRKEAHRFLSLAAAAGLTAGQASAGTVLFSDNFNVDNNTTDASAQGPGRYSGLLGETTVTRAALAQSAILDQQFNPSSAEAALRFVDAGDLTLRRNFAEGAVREAILTAGGFQIEFDRAQTETGNMSWVGVGVGSVIAGDSWIAGSALDFGILLRNNSEAQRWDNGIVANIPNSYVPAADTRHYIFKFELDVAAKDPFADGSLVIASATIDGVPVIVGTAGETTYPFVWEDNGGILQIQFFFSFAGGGVDNLTISTIGGAESGPPGPLSLAVDLKGGTVTGNFSGTPGASYTLQRTANLAEGPWVQVGLPTVAPVNGQVVIIDEAPPAEGEAFYRIVYTP